MSSTPAVMLIGGGNFTGGLHDFLLTRGCGGGVRQGLRQSGKKAPEVLGSSRAARREAMRQAKIPTSQQPVARHGPKDNPQYEYGVPIPLGGKGRRVVTHHPADENRPHPHWEVSTPKESGERDPLGRLRYDNTDRISGKRKVKVPYRR